jgi:hypothetical protein
MSRVKRWIVAVAVVWGLAVFGLGYYSLRTGRPTAREQTTIAQALPTVDGALADVASTLESGTSVTALSGYAKMGRTCSVTAVREGARYERTLMVYTKEGTEPALLDRIRSGLPARYKVVVTHGEQIQTISADAGNFVAVKGGVAAPGQLRFTADTGCRAQDARVDDEASPAIGDRAPVQAVLDALKLTAARWHTYRVACRSGGALWTVEGVTSAGTAPPALPAALRPAAGGASAVLSRPEAYAYRSGPAGVAVLIVDGKLVITSTTGCLR